MGWPIFWGCTRRVTVATLLIILKGPMRAMRMSREEKKRFKRKAPCTVLYYIGNKCKRNTEEHRKRRRGMQGEEAAVMNTSDSEDWQFCD